MAFCPVTCPQLSDESLSYDGLEGLKIGKFFKRAFHWKGIRRKIPRIIAGGAGAILTGGTGRSVSSALLTAGIGGVAAAIPKRKAGTSVLKDVLIGGGIGAAVGTPIGIYRGLKRPTGDLLDVGLAGKATQYVKQRFFTPKPIPKKIVRNPQASGVPAGKVLKSTTPTDSSIWKDVLATGGEALKAGIPIATAAVLQSMAGSPVVDEGQVSVLSPAGERESVLREGAYVDQPVYGEDLPFGVPSDMASMPMIDPQTGEQVIMSAITDPQTGEVKYIARVPGFFEKYKTEIIVGAGALVLGVVLYRAFAK